MSSWHVSCLETMYCDCCSVGLSWMLLYQAPAGHECRRLLLKLVGPPLVLHCLKLLESQEECFCSFFWPLWMMFPPSGWDDPTGGSRMQNQRSVCQNQLCWYKYIWSIWTSCEEWFSFSGVGGLNYIVDSCANQLVYNTKLYTKSHPWVWLLCPERRQSLWNIP